MNRLLIYCGILFSQYFFFCIGYSSISLSHRQFIVRAISSEPSILKEHTSTFLTNKQHLVDLTTKGNWKHQITKLWMQRDYEREVRNNESPTSVINFKFSEILLAVNAIIFLFTIRNPILLRKFAKNDYRLARGEIYRFFTALFLHGDIPHLISNCYSLSQVGPQVEKMFGAKYFLLIYLGAGILANVGTYVFSTSPVAVGASGAICGLLGAYTYFYWANRKILGRQSDYALETIKRTILYNLIFALGGARNIDNWAHAFGFVGGVGITAILFLIRDLKRKSRSLTFPKRQARRKFLDKSSPWERLKQLFRPSAAKARDVRDSYLDEDDFDFDIIFENSDN